VRRAKKPVASLRIFGLAWPLIMIASSLLAADPASAPQARVRIELRLKGPASAPLHGKVTLRPTQSGFDAPRIADLDGSFTVVPLPPNSSWEVSVSLPGYWSRRENIQLGPSDSEVEQPIVVWPLGTISGSVPRLARPLSGIEVETLAPRSPAAKEAALKGALHCPVDTEGRWACSLPASEFDLKLWAMGFAPEYRVAVQVPPTGNVDLGPLTLRQGASVAGWVQAAQGHLTSECVVSLTAADPDKSTLSGNVQGNGFFQLLGVKPGNYLLEAHQPGYRTVNLAIRVSAEPSTLLQAPFILQRVPAP
jgi:hypothetical protein